MSKLSLAVLSIVAIAAATLGDEGWELVSVVDEDDPVLDGLTYFFKRSARVMP